MGQSSANCDVTSSVLNISGDGRCCKVFPSAGLERHLGIWYVKAPDIRDFRHYEGSRVVTPTHWPSLPP